MIEKTIQQRRSVFPAQYNGETIQKEEIEKILEAANWAPTHKKTEPWRFKVFHGDSQRELGDFLARKYTETVSNFSEFKRNKIREKPAQSACVIAVCMQRDPAECVPEWEEVAAVAMAVQNMWLLAHEMGIGAYWSSPSLIQYLNEWIPMEEGERCLGFFYMGKYNGVLPQGVRKTTIGDKTTWV